MKILHINSYYAGGKFYKNLYDNQDKNELDISTFVPVDKKFKNKDFDYGQYITIIPIFNNFSIFSLNINTKKIKKQFETYYEVNDYDLVNVYFSQRIRGIDKQFEEGLVEHSIESLDKGDFVLKIYKVIINYRKYSENYINNVNIFQCEKYMGIGI